MSILYFAYSTDLDREQMKEQCPGSESLFIAALNGHTLGFTTYSRRSGGGKADLLPAEGGSVWGGIYSVSESDLIVLDELFEAPKVYERVLLTVVGVNFVSYQAWSYQVVTKKSGLEPNEGYLAKIREGAAEWGLPKDYQELLSTFESDEDDHEHG